ncbi:MAG: peptidase M61, partial [Flavobacterium sp.]
IDIIIREKSNGERGILDLMHKLSNEYGVSKPFNDEELFGKITELTYPEVGEFLKTYVAGTTPIPYDFYLAKVGLTQSKKPVAAPVFLKDKTPYVTVDQTNNEISILPNIELNTFFTSLDLKGGDVILEINNIAYSYKNIYDMITESSKWKENDAISIKIKRNGKEQVIKGSVKLPYESTDHIEVNDTSKKQLKDAWLKG